MKNAKKLLSFLIIGVVVCTHAYNDYQTCHAAEAVVGGGLASAGVALLTLGAIAGVGMELDNNRRFNELSDEEKQRIENGLATNFEDVALQRGASIEHIKNWTTDLCNGVLDKASECWGIFKDWIKNVDLKNSSWNPPATGSTINGSIILGMSNGNVTISNDLVDRINAIKGVNTIMVRNVSNGNIGVWVCHTEPLNGYITVNTNGITFTQTPSGVSRGTSTANNYLYGYTNYDSVMAIYSSYPVYITDINSGQIINDNVNGTGTSVNVSSFFSTNTDYLEKLKGQDEDVIDVIDVTDIKNPIVETRPNSLARIDWNRGTRRTNNNNDDDDNKMVTGLVPMDVWYERIDDEQEQMKNAVVVYDNYIQEHPEEKDTYFISTAPVTNINNYFNTLPVVNIPAQGTVVNNNYEYNNYNNNNVTIYQEPYSAGIIPTFPDFSKKFPFCIPFDLYEFFVVFLAEKEAPKIEVPFPVLDNTNHQLTVEHITIDLSGYEYLSDVLRVMLFVLFCVGLMILTRQLIKG